MSQPQPLQTRVLTLLAEQGTVRVSELPHWIRGVDAIALDCCLTALMRANKVSRTLGMYELVKADRPVQERLKEPSVAMPVVVTACGSTLPPERVAQLSKGLQRTLAARTPTAAEEAAASLLPIEPTSYCLACNQTKPEKEFQKSKLGKLYKRCKACYSGLVSAGIQRSRDQRQRPLPSKSPQGEPALTQTDGLPGTSEWVSQQPQGNAHESPASNTATEPTTVSLESSPDKEPPTAADSAVGRMINGTDPAAGQGGEVAREAGNLQADPGKIPGNTAPVSGESRNQPASPASHDSVLDAIERKRERLVATKEALSGAFEAARVDLLTQYQRDTEPLQQALEELDDLELRVKALVAEVAG